MFSENSFHPAFASGSIRLGRRASTQPLTATVHGVVFAFFVASSVAPKADIAATMAGCNKRGFARSQMTFEPSVRIGLRLTTKTNLPRKQTHELFTTHASQGLRRDRGPGWHRRAPCGPRPERRVHLQIRQQPAGHPSVERAR